MPLSSPERKCLMDQIETRLNSPHKYLVNAAQPGVAYHEDAFMHQDADFTDVLGCGSKMYLFEAGGRKLTGFVLALVYADSITEAEKYIQEEFGDKLKRGALIRFSKSPEELIDERTPVPETSRMSDWRLTMRTFDGTKVWQCYRLRDIYSKSPEDDRLYDAEIFRDKKEASERCKSLNAKLVCGWMSDGHPRNW